MAMTSEIKIYGVLGYPAKHSLSPLMHNAAFKALNINAEYRIFEIEPDNLEGFVRSLESQNIHGLNVTVPYKEKVIPFMDAVSNEAMLIGAVNTVSLSQGKSQGFNTDGEGFFKHLSEDLGFNVTGASIAIIGAGGAARAISVYLSKASPKRISIYDVDGVKLLGLVNNLKKNFTNIEFNPVSSAEKLDINNADLLINASPVGMKESDCCLVDEICFHKDLLVYDLIYNPEETRLLAAAKKAGAGVSNGLGMLLYQGMIAFTIWTGQKAPKSIMQEALLTGIGSR